jgi:zinc transport system ATP-binding protein
MSADTAAPIVRAEGLTVVRGALQVLQGVGFSLYPGQFLAVLGPNGSGKTTLVQALLGAVPYQGRIDSRARRIGYVPQLKGFDRSFPGRAEELVRSGLSNAWPFRRRGAEVQKARAALERVGAAAVADRPISRLSGGQLQRVYLARALVHEPDLLLLDEPAAGVDVVGERDLYQLLEQQQADHPDLAILMVTHDWEVARHHAHTSLVLNGRAIAFGPSAEVLTEHCLRQAFGHLGHAHHLGSPAGHD